MSTLGTAICYAIGALLFFLTMYFFGGWVWGV